MSDHRRTHHDPANAALGLTAIAAVDNHDEDCFRLGTKVSSGQDYRMITSDEAPYPDAHQAQQATDAEIARLQADDQERPDRFTRSATSRLGSGTGVRCLPSSCFVRTSSRPTAGSSSS